VHNIKKYGLKYVQSAKKDCGIKDMGRGIRAGAKLLLYHRAFTLIWQERESTVFVERFSLSSIGIIFSRAGIIAGNPFVREENLR